MGLLALVALLALVSIFGIVVSGEDTDRPSDPTDDPLLWATLGRHTLGRH